MCLDAACLLAGTRAAPQVGSGLHAAPSVPSSWSVLAPPAQTYKLDLMHREVPGIESVYLEGQSHAFCVSQQQSDELAAAVVPMVEAAVAGARTPAGAGSGSRL